MKNNKDGFWEITLKKLFLEIINLQSRIEILEANYHDRGFPETRLRKVEEEQQRLDRSLEWYNERLQELEKETPLKIKVAQIKKELELLKQNFEDSEFD